MMKRAVSVLLVIVGFINFFPIVGFVSADMLVALYGIDAPQGDLLILLRHRALLFGLLGALIIVSAFRKALQPLAIIAGFVAMMGFIVLAFLDPNRGEKIQAVVNIDVVAIFLLAVVVFLKAKIRTAESS